MSLAGRAGGRLALAAAWANGTVSVFWRWAWVACTETFPNAYYLFHASVADGRVGDDNVLVYFEAPRPSRGPPADLVLLITAGVAVSVIFLLVRRALRRDRTG